MRSRHHYYNKALRPLANGLRNNATMAEACLWKYGLRASMMKGYPFRRQRPVLQYIVDFMCKELMLIIEVDGKVHNDADKTVEDLRRQQELETVGFTVLRFTNREVLWEMEKVRKVIEAWIEQQERRNTAE